MSDKAVKFSEELFRSGGFTPVRYHLAIFPARVELDCPVTYIPLRFSTMSRNDIVGTTESKPRAQLAQGKDVLWSEMLTIEILAGYRIVMQVPVIDYPGNYPVLGKDFFENAVIEYAHSVDENWGVLVTLLHSREMPLSIPTFLDLSQFRRYSYNEFCSSAEYTSRFREQLSEFNVDAKGAEITIRDEECVNFENPQSSLNMMLVSSVFTRNSSDIGTGSPESVDHASFSFTPAEWTWPPRCMDFCGDYWHKWSHKKKIAVVVTPIVVLTLVGICIAALYGTKIQISYTVTKTEPPSRNN